MSENNIDLNMILLLSCTILVIINLYCNYRHIFMPKIHKSKVTKCLRKLGFNFI